jgi:hypothetical protein
MHDPFRRDEVQDLECKLHLKPHARLLVHVDGDFEDALRRYNALLRFGQRECDDWPRPFAGVKTQIRARLSKVEEALASAHAALDEANKVLQGQYQPLMGYVASRDEWYARGCTCLPLHKLPLADLRSMLRRAPPKDSLLFAAAATICVRDLFPWPYMDRGRQLSASISTSESDALTKVEVLFTSLLSLGSDELSTRALFNFCTSTFVHVPQMRATPVRLKALEYLGHPYRIAWSTLHDNIMDVIGSCVGMNMCPHKRGNSFAAQGARIVPAYLDCASALRDLTEAWSRQNGRYCLRPSKSRNFKHFCFHVRCLPLLERLSTRAHEETRSLIVLAASGRLPDELVDEIHGYVLKAERLPQRPGVLVPVAIPLELGPADLQCRWKCNGMR